MVPFSDRQRARLARAFVEVDALLREAAQCLDAAAVEPPFARYAADVPPIRCELFVHGAAQLRALMRQAAERHRLRLPRPGQSAGHSARAALRRAVITVEELGPRYLCGYGALSAELEAELNRIVSPLLDLLDQMDAYLAPIDTGGLSARIDRLRPAGGTQAVLRELERVIGAHDIAPLRERLLQLTARVEADDFVIGVFGRVNAGKSSLLNALLRAELLPTGATPVTTVPVRITYGAHTHGLVQFADATPETLPAGRLAEFAAARFNPANARHVTELRVETPLDLLRDRVVLIDLPGDDFERSPGRDEPPCDAGIVLIDATGPLALHKAAIVDRLQRAGAAVMVLLAKADRLSAEERWSVYGHVWRELAVKIGREIPLFLAASCGDDPVLRDDWIERGLRAWLRERRAIRQRSLGVKLAALGEDAAAALQRRMARACGSMVLSPAARARIAEQLAHASALLAAAAAERFDPRAEAKNRTAALIDEVAGNAAVLWRERRGATLDATTLLNAAVKAAAAGTAATVAKNLMKLHAQCDEALSAGGAPDARSRSRLKPNPPPFPGVAAWSPVALRRPPAAFLGRRWRTRAWRRALARAPLPALIETVLREYFETLRSWRAEHLSEIERDRRRAARGWRAALRAAADTDTQAAHRRALADDLAQLRRILANDQPQPRRGPVDIAARTGTTAPFPDRTTP
jgi:GTP-binding protein EngB required for normal cell division